MAVLEILQYPDPRLRIKAESVTQIDDDIRKKVEDMYETMYVNQGVGLAATQVNIHLQIFTMDISDTRDKPLCVINPEILTKSGMQYDYHGCLSVGAGLGISDKLERAAKLRLRGMDLDGKIFEWDLDELAAICVQHEVDHLNGILFIDHLSRLKLDRIRKKIDKAQRRV